jgi:hypothetical protein
MYLGMHIVHDRTAGIITIDQKGKIAELASLYNIDTTVKVLTPMEPGSVLQKATADDTAEDFPYRELVGSLLWIGRATRPDILYAVGCVARQVSCPLPVHVTAALRILQYLVSTAGQMLTLRKPSNFTGTLSVSIYSDANFAREPEGSNDAMKSTSGLLVMIDGVGCIYAQSILQSVAGSTHEAEYIAMDRAAKFAVSLIQMCSDMQVKVVSPIMLLCDNQSAIASVKSPICSAKPRHIKVCYHYVRELVRDKILRIVFCPSPEMKADIMTKALALPLLRKGVKDIFMIEEMGSVALSSILIKEYLHEKKTVEDAVEV